MIDVPVPQWGLTMDEAVLDSWLKKVGDRIEAGEAIAEVETDKLTSELESPAAGTIAELLVQPGDSVVQGQVVARIQED